MISSGLQSGKERIVLLGDNATALSAAACLRGHHITVVSLSNEPRMASLSRFVKDRILVPEGPVSEVLGRLERFHARGAEKLVLFPCSDTWIEILTADLRRTLALGTMLPLTSGHLALTSDKLAFARGIGRLGLPHPAVFSTEVDSKWMPPSYPIVLKPSSTYRLEVQCGVKAVLIRGREQWHSFDKRLLEQHAFLAQEYLEGPSISVCFCTTADGRLAGSYATEKVHFSSMSSGSRVATVTRPDAIELASEFMLRTGFVGFGELEMIDSERGLVLLELNARPWSQVLMSESLGVPILEMAVALMSGRELTPCDGGVTLPLEWISWDHDLLFRRRLRREGRPIRRQLARKRVYAQSFLRDPIPALVHALTVSRLGPARFFHPR